MPNISIPITPSGVIGGANSFDDLASTIANPPADRPIQGAIGNGGQDFCDFVGAVPEGAEIVLGQFGPIIGLLCKPYWDGQGYDPPIPSDPPYEGGQCAELYEVFATTSGTDLFIGGQTPKNLQGPLGSVTEIRTVIGNPFPDTTRYQFIFAGPAEGVEFTARADFTPAPGFRVAGIVGGAPDVCGDPPPDTPYQPGANPPPEPPGYTPGQDFGLGPDGQPFFFVPPLDDPLDPTGEPVDFDPSDPFGGEPDFPPDNPSGGPESVGPGAESGGGAGGAAEDIPFGDPPPGRVWVGAIARFVASSATGGIPGTGPENTVYPRVVGNFSLTYGAVRGQANQVRSEWFEVMRPNDALEVTGARVNSIPGVSVITYPISALISLPPTTSSVE